MDTRQNRDDWSQEFSKWKSMKQRREQIIAQREQMHPKMVEVSPAVEVQVEKRPSVFGKISSWFNN